MRYKDNVETLDGLLGSTLVSAVRGEDDSGDYYGGGESIVFTTDSGEKYRMMHYQDCCENVYIEDISGDLDDLLHSPVTVAEAVSRNDAKASESGTWTFYKIGTIKQTITIRWYGSSNGYYSEAVDFAKID